ncbi:MAG: HlyD family efflux transporter periplasmic adaptor subunit [Pseudomonadota bacterium]
MTETNALEPDAPLPALREDLRVLPGKAERTGQRTWLIFDPLRNRYFQIDGRSLAILKAWHAGTPGGILHALRDPDITMVEIEAFVRFVFANALTRDPAQGDVNNFVAQAEAGQRGILSTAVHSYLFFRIPLVRPHAFLKRTVGLTEVFFRPGWWVFLGLLLLAGGYLTLRQWDQFVHTFMHFFSLQGLAYYFLALIFVKIAHELGHAFTATRYGCRVSTMGVAFLVMFPVLFTDTTESWKLQSKRQRLTITAAGVLTELMIAIFSTFLWAFLPDGPWRSAAFFVATTSWIMSIAVNLNPFMRFDGYHFLSDLIGIQNLQARSFAFGRWRLRELLFGLGDPMPEMMDMGMRRGLTVLAWCIWVYRFFLFLGIALLVHALFFKLLGIILFVIEIGWFIMIPILNEMKEWWGRRADIAARSQWTRPAIALIGLTMVLIVPWQSTIRMPAVFEAQEQTALFSPEPAQIVDVLVHNGQRVKAGDKLVRLTSPDLLTQIRLEERRLKLTRARLGRIVADRDDRDQNLVLQREARQRRDAIAGLRRQLANLDIVAPFDGVVIDLADHLHSGRWVEQTLPILSVAEMAQGRMRGYLFSEYTERLSVGAKAVFIPDEIELKKMRGTVSRIASANSQRISLPVLTSRFGGAIAVSETQDDLDPLQTWYGIVIEPDARSEAPVRVVRGQIHAKGKPESLALRIWRRLAHILIRETTL